MPNTISFSGESATSDIPSGDSSEGGSFDKTRITERKKLAVEPDSLEEQEFRRSFEVDYNRSLDIVHQDSNEEPKPPTIIQHDERQRNQMESDFGSQSSFETDLPTLREHERPSFELADEDQFIRNRQNYFHEGVSDSLDLGTSTDTDAPPPPRRAPRRGGKSPAAPPTIISEFFVPYLKKFLAHCIYPWQISGHGVTTDESLVLSLAFLRERPPYTLETLQSRPADNNPCSSNETL